VHFAGEAQNRGIEVKRELERGGTMYELHLRQLESRHVREENPLHASEVVLRARQLARRHVRVRARSPGDAARAACVARLQPRRSPARTAGF
jgi:predicted nuclease with RNAse H fold